MTSPADTIRKELDSLDSLCCRTPVCADFSAIAAALTKLEAEVTRWQDGYDVAAMRANRAEAKLDEALRVTAAAAEVDTARIGAAEADRDRYREALEQIARLDTRDDEASLDIARAALAAPDTPPDYEAIARRFHESYERLASEFSYETRKASAVPWDDVPENNRLLMIATVRAVFAATPDTPPDA